MVFFAWQYSTESSRTIFKLKYCPKKKQSAEQLVIKVIFSVCLLNIYEKYR